MRASNAVVSSPTTPCPNTATCSPTIGWPSIRKVTAVSTLGRKAAASGETPAGTQDELGRPCQKMALVRMEAHHQLSQPLSADVRARGRDPAHGGVAVFEGEGERLGEGGDGRVEGHVGRHPAAIDQHLGARADRGYDGLDHHLSGAGRRQWLFPHRHAVGCDEVQGPSTGGHRPTGGYR